MVAPVPRASRALALSLSASLSACALPAPVSEDISSRDIDLTLRVEDTGQGALATVELINPLGPIPLTGGDRLRITTSLGESDFQDAGSADGRRLFHAALGDVSGPMSFDLVRKHDESSLGHAIVLPPPFTITRAPSDDASSIAFTWDAPPEGAQDYTLTATLEGACITPLQRPLVRDVGAYAFAWSDIQKQPSTAATCPLTITVRRSTNLTNQRLFPGEPSGWLSITTEQRRSLSLSP